MGSPGWVTVREGPAESNVKSWPGPKYRVCRERGGGKAAFCRTPAINVFHAGSFSLGAKISGIETFPCSIRSPMLESLHYSCLPGSKAGTPASLGQAWEIKRQMVTGSVKV